MDRQLEKKKWTFGKIALYGGGLAIAAILIAAIYRESGVSRLNVESNRLLIDTVAIDIFKEYITLFGVVEPIKTVFLDAVESGRVEEIFVENGAMVDKQKEIMRLSNLDLQLSVLNQEASIISQINTIRNTSILMDQQSLSLKEQALDVEFQIDLLDKRTKRNEELFTDKIISEVDFQETQDEFEHLLRRRKLLTATIQKDSLFNAMQQDQMKTTLTLMNRNLEIAKNSLKNLIVQAPIKGQISGLDSEVGELINRGDRIAQIDVLDDYKVRAQIDEYYISRIFPQQTGTFTLNNQTYELQIQKIYPEVVDGSFAVDLVFTGTRPDNIKRGQTLSLKLSLSDETQATLLAKGGFFQSSGGNWVYVVDPSSGNAIKRDIRVGRQNPNFYEVLDGLSPGEVVIISSYENFGDKDVLVLK